MRSYLQVVAFLSSSIILLTGCSNSSDDTTPIADLSIKVQFLMDGSPLVFNEEEYVNASGNRFTVEDFKFYLSNLKLRNEDNGDLFVEPESYHLISKPAESHVFELTIPDVPLTSYSHLDFAVGVDPTRNLSIDQVGDLDPSNNMAWDWNTGYKFILMEGRFFPEDGSDTRGLVVHIGEDANYRELSFALATEGAVDLANISQGQELVLRVEASQLFQTPNQIDLEEKNVFMFGEGAGLIAENFTNGMFSLSWQAAQ